MPGHADWIAADWGTTNLRLWALNTGGAVIGAPRITAPYMAAPTHLGATAATADGTGLALAGLRAAHAHLEILPQ